MIAYRIVHVNVKDLFTGSGFDSRWCNGGRKIIYTSSSIALACLENILRRSGLGFASNFKTVYYKIPDNLNIKIFNINLLKADWRKKESYTYCQQFGNAWYDKKESFIMKVPSAIIPDEFNYIIKMIAAELKQIKIIDEKLFSPDERLEQLLKKQ